MEGFSFIDESVAGMPLPTSEDMTFLRSKGITAIVGLKGSPVEEETLGGMRYLHMPIQDFSAPILDLQKRFVEEVTAEVGKGGKVAVHCKAGMGRTGTMLATWLVNQGKTAEEAVSVVRQLRPGSLQSDEQVEAVGVYERKTRQ